MNTDTQIALSVETLEESYDIIAPRIPEIVNRMYNRLFEVSPRVVDIFAGKDPSKQLRTVYILRDSFDDLSSLTPELEALGERHASWGVQPRDYAIMGPVLLEAMAASVDPYWRSEYTTAWAALFQTVEDIMLRGAARAQHAPTG
jgi:hemoglobin-like flavoprotein